jgi:hypothetical protein
MPAMRPRQSRPPAFSGLLLLACLAVASTAQARCPPAGYDLAALQNLKAAKFELPDPAARDALAVDLVDCLGDPDPALRDGIAYEALAGWMRNGALDAPALRRLQARLLPMLAQADPAGFRRPFAALVLAEVARSDRMQPWMTDGERGAMVGAAADYEAAVDDYRGFDPAEGWRHGVAHGADWLMQLALNPALDRAQLDRILAAVAVQVVPAAGHAYVFGEPERLARPLLFVARRGLHGEAEWTAWLSERIADLGPARPGDPAWLARRHDLLALLRVLYVEADLAQEANIKRLKPVVAAALERLQ